MLSLFLRRPGTIILALSWLLNFYTQWQLIEINGMQPELVVQYLNYLNICSKLKRWNLVLHLAGNIVDMVGAGILLNKFQDMVCPGCSHDIKSSHLLIIFASFVFLNVLASYHFPRFNSVMRRYSVFATVVISFRSEIYTEFSCVFFFLLIYQVNYTTLNFITIIKLTISFIIIIITLNAYLLHLRLYTIPPSSLHFFRYRQESVSTKNIEGKISSIELLLFYCFYRLTKEQFRYNRIVHFPIHSLNNGSTENNATNLSN